MEVEWWLTANTLVSVGVGSLQMPTFAFRKKPAGGGGGLNSSISGATMSENNAVNEFLLKREDIQSACERGELKFSWRSCHGNSYRLFNRSEIKALAEKCEPDPILKAKRDKQQHAERVANSKSELESVSNELANIDNRKEFLVRRKAELQEFLEENSFNKANKKQKL